MRTIQFLYVDQNYTTYKNFEKPSQTLSYSSAILQFLLPMLTLSDTGCTLGGTLHASRSLKGSTDGKLSLQAPQAATLAPERVVDFSNARGAMP
ncbi:hypothetical protein [Bordetella petrii]|uniref:hypothetical protein n=1 Tax=Bordetella petrii TaxID=94624 RepID=UPI001E42D67F|nr:hypothetical protein [Bordetella petrii]MCD0503885.1 hypothetical protein [Bordetella petrii]